VHFVIWYLKPAIAAIGLNPNYLFGIQVFHSSKELNYQLIINDLLIFRSNMCQKVSIQSTIQNLKDC